jgi:hypothetical protein
MRDYVVRYLDSPKQYTWVDTVDNAPSQIGMQEMTIMTEENGWAIVLMNNRYYIRHIVCGRYIRHTYKTGCLCRGLNVKSTPAGTAAQFTTTQVDDTIMKKFILLTKGEKL